MENAIKSESPLGIVEDVPSPRAKKKPQISALQVFRGIAAMAVVLYHATLSTTVFVATVPNFATSIFGKGFLGVDFFFVLSGFIIMYAHSSDEHSLATVRRYAFKRVVRIFPAYLPITIVMIALYSGFPKLSSGGVRDYSLLSSLLLVPADRPPILTVAWSLVHELLFYATFIVFFLSRRLFVFALLAWAGIIVGVNMSDTPTNWLRYPFSLLNIEFILGVCAAWIVTANLTRLRPLWFVLAGIVLSSTIAVLVDLSSISLLRVSFAAGLALIIVGFAQWEHEIAINWPAWLVLIGNASYSIYLIHNQVFSITQRVSKYAGFNWELGLVFAFLGALLVGYVYHVAVEKRAIAFFAVHAKRNKEAA